MGAGHTYSLLFFCIFIKTSIFSSISFCISFRRESKAKIIIWKGLLNLFPLPCYANHSDHASLLLRHPHWPRLRGLMGHM